MFVLMIMIMIVTSLVGTKSKRASFVCCAFAESSTPWVLELFYLFCFISFAKGNKTFNVTKLKKGVGRDNATKQKEHEKLRMTIIQKKRLTTYNKGSDEIADGHYYIFNKQS